MIYGYSAMMGPAATFTSISFNRKPAGRILATAAADKWDARYVHNPPHTTDFYLKCCIGGVLSCGLTHLAVTPLDVAKCNMQVCESQINFSDMHIYASHRRKK
jgi:hypothetical protein